VIRYFKNERFGFSVTYYEANRPRQYYPDFLVVTGDQNGREVMWLAETKGEMRPNTPLKSEAARLWCEQISKTNYGEWRYILLPQSRFEAGLKKGVKSLRELSNILEPAASETAPIVVPNAPLPPPTGPETEPAALE
jgi:hypothetical protein